MKIQIEIKPDLIWNATIGVVEGGYSDWLCSLNITNSALCYDEKDTWDIEKNPGLMINVVYDEEDKEEGSFTGVKNIGWADIKKGLELMAAKSHQFGNLISENDDAFTHDALWQYIVLGELVYG